MKMLPPQLYMCYSPTGPSGPYYASDDILLKMGSGRIDTFVPNITVAGCAYVVMTSYLWLQSIVMLPAGRECDRRAASHRNVVWIAP
jgi:hypothetical protein